MSLAIRNSSIRPSIDIPFYVSSEEFKEYKNKNYVEPGHILFQQTTLSDDKLTQISFVVFANREARILFLSDERIKEETENRLNYNRINNITIERVYMLD